MTDSPNADNGSTAEPEPPTLEETIDGLRRQALDENTDADRAVGYLLSMLRQIVSDRRPESDGQAVTALMDQCDAVVTEWLERDGDALLLAMAAAHRQIEAQFDEHARQRAAFMRRLSAAEWRLQAGFDFLVQGLQTFAIAHREATGSSHLDVFGTDTRIQLTSRKGEVRIASRGEFIEGLADDPDLRARWAEQVWTLTEPPPALKKALTVEFAANEGDVDELRAGTTWVGPSTTATIKHAGQS